MFKLTRAVSILLVTNLAVTVTFLILNRVSPAVAGQLAHYTFLTPSLVAHGFIWQLVTYLFIHVDPTHLLVNMLGLWLLGIFFERSWGTRGFLEFILYSGMGAGVAVVLTGLVWPSALNHPTIGLSGSLNALLMAFALTYPDQTVYLYGFFPLKGKYVVAITVIMELLFSLAGSALSLPAHIGGLIMGYLLVTGKWRPTYWIRRLRWRKIASRKVVYPVRSKPDRYIH